MNSLIAEAIAHLPIRPGHPYRTNVNGREFEVRVVEARAVSEETPTDGLWLDIPPSAAARRITLTRGPRQLPDPIRIGEEDVAPE
jgi:hypothetical protein